MGSTTADGQIGWPGDVKEDEMLVECQTCPARGLRCDDCMVSTLLASPAPAALDAGLPLDRKERAAVGAFVRAGLVSHHEANGLRATLERGDRYGAVG